MKSLLSKLLVLALIVIGGVPCAAFSATEPAPLAMILEIEGSIGPATSDYLERAFNKADQQRAALLVLRLDTPGGLDSAMRSIIKLITTSSVPVVAYVAPSGARAASAGTYIVYASHIAAMAPGTNLGAATPIQIGGLSGGGEDHDEVAGAEEKKPEPGTAKGGTMHRKLVNDAAAYLRSLAQMRGRNVEWAEKAVREAVSLSAEEALQIGVIDLIATDTADLLKQIHGRTVNIGGKERLLKTRGLVLDRIEPDWRNRLLAVISNPNIAYILMLIGIYGLVYEFANPGVFLPGTLGAICLLLALYAFQALPINYTGMGLILFGLALMVAEAFVPSFGALGLGGIAAFVIGSIILVDTEAPGYGISPALIIAFAFGSAAILILVVGLAIKARSRPVVSGREQLLGAEGLAVGAFDSEGQVRVHGEIWKARSDRPLIQGQRLRVTGRKGLTLRVTPVDNDEENT